MSAITETTIGVDALERELFRYTVQSITEELEINITRTAYSPLIQESQDYCVALTSADFRPYMQSEASIPIFVYDMGEPIRAAVGTIGLENLEAGDVFVINHETGQHLNNVVMATPLFHGEEITGYLGIRAHWADVGGLGPGGQSMAARSIFHEGTRYAGIRLMRAGVVVPEVLATIQANTYQREMLTGDVMAQLAACVLGARRWQERVVSRWDADEVNEIITAQFVNSAHFARRAVSAIPDGEYEASHRWAFTHGDTEVDLLLKLRVIVSGDRLTVDMSEMPPQVPFPFNAGAVGGGAAAVNLAFRYLVGGDAPTDNGFFEPVEVILPPGTIVSATGDAPMGFWNATMARIIELFIRAIGQAHPELTPASHSASNGGILLHGLRPDGSLWRHADGAVGGLGAEEDRDGYGPVPSLMTGDMKRLPIEMIEKRFPIIYRLYRLDRETGGAGLHRGGPGVERIFELASDASVDAYPEQSDPAPGLAGGKPGALGWVGFRKPGTDRWLSPGEGGSQAQHMPAGTVIWQKSGGGGGWGSPE